MSAQGCPLIFDQKRLGRPKLYLLQKKIIKNKKSILAKSRRSLTADRSMVLQYIGQDIQTLAYRPSTSNMAYHLKYAMAAQCNVYLEIGALFTAGQMEALLKYSLISAHTDKSNTSFKSIKTLRLFVCTHNNNKTLCFCKIIKANRMRFLPSRSR